MVAHPNVSCWVSEVQPSIGRKSSALLGGPAERAGQRGAGIDLVLLDLGLPDGDGEALLAALRKRHSIPQIVISARDSDGNKIRLLDSGADGYLVKPFAIGELLARMCVSLRHRGTRVSPTVTRYEVLSIGAAVATEIANQAEHAQRRRWSGNGWPRNLLARRCPARRASRLRQPRFSRDKARRHVELRVAALACQGHGTHFAGGCQYIVHLVVTGEILGQGGQAMLLDVVRYC